MRLGYDPLLEFFKTERMRPRVAVSSSATRTAPAEGSGENDVMLLRPLPVSSFILAGERG